MDPVVSETFAGNSKSGRKGENNKMLVPQVIHHTTNDRQHTDKHRKFPEIIGARHGSNGHTHHIGQTQRNHQGEERRELSVDTSTMRTESRYQK